MVTPNEVLLYVGSLALAGGVSVAGRRAVQHAHSVQKLLASIDHRLAHELSKYSIDPEEIRDAHDAALWQDVGGLVGIICLIRQARLWRNIVRKIRERNPRRFIFEGVCIEGDYGALWFAVVLTIIETGFHQICPTLPRVNGRACVNLFLSIAATTEDVILKVDAEGPLEFHYKITP